MNALEEWIQKGGYDERAVMADLADCPHVSDLCESAKTVWKDDATLAAEWLSERLKKWTDHV